MTAQIEDNSHEEEHREEATALMEVGDEVQVIVPPIQIQNPVPQLKYQTPPPITKTTPGSTPTRHYEFKTDKRLH